MPISSESKKLKRGVTSYNILLLNDEFSADLIFEVAVRCTEMRLVSRLIVLDLILLKISILVVVLKVLENDTRCLFIIFLFVTFLGCLRLVLRPVALLFGLMYGI